MIEVGYLAAEGAGGIVYKDGDKFVFHYRGVSMDHTDNERNFETESVPFPTLEALREHYKGFAFRPADSKDFNLDDIRILLKDSKNQLSQLRAIYSDRPKG